MASKTEMSNELREDLKEKLREIFQFENEDLDFGIYRIMNYKRREIEKFIEEDLITEIKNQLDLLSKEEKKGLEEQLKELSSRNGVKKYLEALKSGDKDREEIYRVDFAEDIEKYENLKRQIETVKISEDLEREIYNHLINFFSRYYDKGDFISKRRYGKNEKYMVPYNGEEVLLYWANKDQYYIKTTEYFRKYTFRVGALTVNFRVLEAEEEKGNVKSEEKKFFVLNKRVFDFDNENNELDIYFEYRTLSEDEKKKYKHGNTVSQDKANEETIKILRERIPEKIGELIFRKEGDKTLIERHLYRYTRRNTRDYFIHKDLKEFLERELDFYIKNEFLNLEDLQILDDGGYFDKLKIYIIGLKAFRSIALTIIKFLAQIENFQKKVWEKKKFVIDTNYVITLDKIKEYGGEKFLESILDDILKNEEQLNEWKELFEIDVRNENDLVVNNTLEGKKWKTLPVDTKYFDEDFKWRLLSSLSENNDLDDILDGILIKSENWQALNLLLNKYYEKVQTIYIDPPFNKEQEADYLYKVDYKDATWITMLENRIRLGRDLSNEKGSIFVRCDYNGNMYVRMLLNEIFGRKNFRNEIIVSRISKQDSRVRRFNTASDSLYLYSKSDNFLFNLLFKRLPRAKGARWHAMDSQGQGNPLYIFGYLFDPPKGRHWTYGQKKIKQMEKEGKIRLKCKKCNHIHSSGIWKGCPNCGNKDYVKIEYLLPPTKVKQIDSNWTDISGYTSNWDFQTENSEVLLKRVIESTSNEGDLVLDFFLGSGTTTAVAHKLGRKWIGVEMGDHFWTVVLPRMKKVLAYDRSGISNDIKEKYNPETAGGFFKYHVLEQYEDALENIEFEEPQKTLYDVPNYFVNYMLEWETRNSSTFLNLEELRDPFNYKLKIMDNYQPKLVNVDTVETFNYLLGLHVKTYKTLEDNGRKYVFVFGENERKRTAIIWRSTENIDFEKDKRIIEDNIGDFGPDEIYINGEALVENFRLVEHLFKSLMFEEVR
ncbi:site-specific DNA-methyltransferase [Methanothermobacter sp.]|uniref:site-specific DNA-methyltransferase n=1 Tax=Methanothermobacter sp. TaxID=1884223 RepID=UPI00262011F0|nr:site-specific DNA-methyltransferase [Methanothermobacter sp.]MDI9618885.1 site-specific DNA-methyltransferase [Methanothermobacter sp.]